MKNNISLTSRILLFISALMMIVAIFVPLWRIEMDAPQYPEGLVLLIYPDGVKGDVDIINGLNHYIGMKTIHSEEFIEFTILPYIIGFFALLFAVVGILAKRKLLYTAFVCFVLFGIISMVDFWYWEYDYGHNLDPNAAIKVPGMAYQPPLIGFKQLLNFGAYSIPDIGGWLFLAVGVLLGIAIFFEIKFNKNNQMITSFLISFFLLSQLTACQTGPVPLNIGKDVCSFCKMTISDAKFGAELITDKGKVYKFDEFHCLHAFVKAGSVAESNIKDMYISDYVGNNQLLNVKNAFFLQSEKIHGPMNGNVATFSSQENLKKVQTTLAGNEVKWSNLIQK